MGYEDIKNKLNEVNNGIKIYEKDPKAYENSPNIKNQITNSKKFAKGLENIIVGIDNNKIRIGKDFITEPDSIDLSSMSDPALYEEISQDVFARYNEDPYSLELLSIQSFLDDINSKYIKNKKDALSKFKSIKNKVKSKNLIDYIKDLELTIFGYDENESEYEESIAERTKMRRQNKETDKKDASDGLKRTFASPDPSSNNLDESTEIYHTPPITPKDNEPKIKEPADDQDSKNSYDNEGFNKDGYNINGFNREGFNKDGYNINCINREGFNKDGYNINAIKEYEYVLYHRYHCNKDGFDKFGFNK